MSDLIRKLDKRLTGPNPVAYHKLTPEEWAELRELLRAVHNDMVRRITECFKENEERA